MKIREKYDPDRTVIVNKPFRWAGDQFNEGTTFPEELVKTAGFRKIRQLYDARFLKHGPLKSEIVVPTPTAPAQIVMPEFGELSTDGLRNWLLNNGVNVADDAPRDEMIKMAMFKWRRIHGLSTEPEPVKEPTEEKVVAETLEEPTNGVAVANGDSKHSGQRVQGPVDDGRPKAPERKRLGRQGRSGGDVQHVHRRGH